MGRFRWLWGASAASNVADGVVLAAAPLLAATLTRDPALIAGLVVAQRLPWFLFTLVSGAMVDRLDRRWVIVGANAFRAVVLGVLAALMATGTATLAALYGAAFLLGAAETLVDNAALALLPAIVERDALERSNGRLYATQAVANEFAGPPLGGTLFALAPAAPFALGAAGFAAGAALLGTLRGRFRAEHEPGSLTSEIGEGLRWFWGQRVLRTVGAMAGVLNFFSAATMGVMVLVAQDRLGLDATGFGLLLAAGAVGGGLGGLTADRLAARLGGGGAIFVSNILPAVAYLGIALSREPVFVGAMLALASFAAMVGNVVVISLRQAAIPAHLLGRVTSAYRLIALGALPAGGAFGGLVARELGLLAPFWAAALVLGIMAFVLLGVLSNRVVAEVRSSDA